MDNMDNNYLYILTEIEKYFLRYKEINEKAVIYLPLVIA